MAGLVLQGQNLLFGWICDTMKPLDPAVFVMRKYRFEPTPCIRELVSRGDAVAF